jgi:putative DNA primase/helicase
MYQHPVAAFIRTFAVLPTSVQARRVRYVKAGYEPLPCVGKIPALAGWQAITINVDTPATWSDVYPCATNTGIRTRRAPAVDIDVRDPVVADQLESALRTSFPDARLLVRTGMPPKRLIPFRCEMPFKKMAVSFRSSDGVTHKVEVLGNGQQFIADGVHPDTGKPYTWKDGADLLSVAHGHLPLLDETAARRFITEAGVIMAAAGWAEVRPKTNGKKDGNANTPALPLGPKVANPYYHFALKDECAALATMPKHSGRNDALNRAAFSLFQLVAGGGLDENVVRERLFAAAEACGLVDEDGEASVRATIESGAKAGRAQPRQAPNGGDHGGAHHDDEQDARLRTVAADDVEMQGVDWLWPERFALGKIGLIAGLPDMGKGQIAAFIAAAVTAGIELPCDEGNAPQGNVVWFNAEDGIEDTVVPRLVAAGADLKRVKFCTSVHVDGEDKSFSLVTDLPLLLKTIEQIGHVALVIIDPVSAYLGIGKVDGRSATDVRGVLTPLKALAEELHVAVIAIAHFNKKDDIKSALLRVSDSIAYVAAARHVYAVLDDAEDKNCKLFVKAKNNLARDTKALRYGMGNKVVGHDRKLGVDIDAPYIVWHPQHVEITANEAMAAAGGHTAKREARDFLLERLEAGPVMADDIIEEAKQEGIAKRTLDRAKKELGVKSRKTPSKFDGEWFWELPAKTRPRA